MRLSKPSGNKGLFPYVFLCRSICSCMDSNGANVQVGERVIFDQKSDCLKTSKSNVSVDVFALHNILDYHLRLHIGLFDIVVTKVDGSDIEVDCYYLWGLKIETIFVQLDIRSINIPASCTGINVWHHENLEEASVSSINRHFRYDSDNKVLLDRKKCLLLGFDDSTIPDSVTSIEDCAFDGCKSLKSIIIPDSVKSIGDYAFCGCKSLESIIIPDSVTSIGDLAFSGCVSLKSIKISGSVTHVGRCAFHECKSLKTIKIPDSVTHIDSGAFEGCESLESIVVPDGIKGLSDFTFKDCKSLQKIVLPESVTSLGLAVFDNCETLEEIKLPAALTDMDISTFSGCKSLQSIALPMGVTAMAYRNFFGCDNLETVTIKGVMSKIGEEVVEGCTSLKTINIPIGSRNQFEQLLPKELHCKLVEQP